MINETTRTVGLLVVLCGLLIGAALMVAQLGKAFREIEANTSARNQAFARLDSLEAQIQEIIRTTNDIGARVEKALDEAPPKMILEQLEKSNRQTQEVLGRIYTMLEGARQEAIDRTSPNYRYEDMP